MKCPLCCEFVPNEELLQDHYLTKCQGLAEESLDDDQYGAPAANKKKFQFASKDINDDELFLLSTTLDVCYLDDC